MSSVLPTQSFELPSSPLPSFWTILTEKLNPRACLSSIDVAHDLPLDVAVPMIVADILESPKKRKAALQQLYDLTDQKHKEHRVELVAKYKIVDTLVTLLSKPENRRMALLTLNNLAIPLENKHICMANSALLTGLYTILKELSPDTYLACLCLRNLACLEETSYARLLSFQLEDGQDLMALLQILTLTFAPSLLETTNTKFLLQSVEAHALKWSAGILRQLSTNHPQAVVNKHEGTILTILKLVAHLSEHLPLHHWTPDSLGDSCLMLLVNLAQTNTTTLLKEVSAQRYLTHLIGKGGIHDTRASWIQCSLEGL